MDKTEYTNMMGNFMYDGDPAYKNTFVVKKDMKVASDRDVVEAFLSIAKKNPEAVTKDIANAYNENALFFKKAESKWQKKVSQLTHIVEALQQIERTISPLRIGIGNGITAVAATDKICLGHGRAEAIIVALDNCPLHQ